MLGIGAGKDTRFVGLCPDVRYRVELGFVFADDGERLFKMSLPLFERAIGARPVTAELLDEVIAFVQRHGTIFALFEIEEEASSSLVDAEI